MTCAPESQIGTPKRFDIECDGTGFPLPEIAPTAPHFQAALGQANGTARSLPNVSRDQNKLIQRSLQVLGNLCGDHVRIGQIGRIL